MPRKTFSIVNSVITNKLELPLKELLATKLRDSGNSDSNSNCSRARVSRIISDVGMCSFTLRVAEELGIPAVLLETASASSLLAYYHCRQLLDKGIIPGPFKSSQFSNHPLINTFEALEQDVLEELSTISPNIYPIGPLNLMVDHHISKKDTINIGATTILCDNEEHSSIDDREYMKWLDSQEPKSVLYVSFGSITRVNKEKLIEIAWGLANSLAKFLWIVRTDQVIEENNCLEFNLFEEEIKGGGVLINWCDQEKVLAHPSIGGFFTHCGWNSTIESISYGVPMICWPLAADQMTNSWRCCNRLNIGMKMSEEANRDCVERVVKEFVVGDKKWKRDEDKGYKMEKHCNRSNHEFKWILV